MLIRTGGTFGVIGAMLAAEKFLVAKYLPAAMEPSETPALPKAFGAVIFFNFVVVSFTVMALGFKAGMARKKFIEKAKKEGDERAEERFSYPNLYAEGLTPLAKEYNCVQRGHHGALENLPAFLVLSAAGGLKHPVGVALSGLVWAIARWKWAEGYATGEPKNRYARSGNWGFHVWTALMFVMSASVSTAISITGLL